MAKTALSADEQFTESVNHQNSDESVDENERDEKEKQHTEISINFSPRYVNKNIVIRVVWK